MRQARATRNSGMHRISVGIGLLACALTTSTTYAQDGNKSGLPDTTACPAAIVDIATCYSAKHETGAYLLAAMPKQWNGNLIVFGHGGPAVVPPTAAGSQVDLAKYAIEINWATPGLHPVTAAKATASRWQPRIPTTRGAFSSNV